MRWHGTRMRRAKMPRAYDAYDFPRIFHALNALATVDLSAFYVDVSKDRLYTLAAAIARAGAPRRPRCTLIADGLARLMAPILPVTAEQLWKVLPGATGDIGAHGGIP